jgi:hypothetical protein
MCSTVPHVHTMYMYMYRLLAEQKLARRQIRDLYFNLFIYSMGKPLPGTTIYSTIYYYKSSMLALYAKKFI